MILHKPMEIVPDCWDDGTGIISKCAYNDYPTPVDLVLEPTDHVPVLVTDTKTDPATGEVITTVTDTVTGSSVTNITQPETATTTTIVQDIAGNVSTTETTPPTPDNSCDYPWWLLAVGFGIGYLVKKSKK